MGSTKKPFIEQVSDRLIDMLQEGTAPWMLPWGAAAGFMPMNPTTGNRYKGINALALMAEQRTDPRWMTYKQAQGIGAQVRKNEKSTTIQFWKTHNEYIKKDDNGKPVLDNDGKPIKIKVLIERPYVFYAYVFNAEQIDGLPPFAKKEISWSPIERVEGILAASGANLKHSESNTAYYSPAKDTIFMPNKEQFSSADKYYATALHELGHWTGHVSRLNRDILHPFGSEGYAREELRSETFSMILGEETGIGHDPGQHAAYVGSWIKVLKNDPSEIFRAAADAEKMQSYVLAMEKKLVQADTVMLEQNMTQKQPDEQANEYAPLGNDEKIKLLKLAREQLSERSVQQDTEREKALAEMAAGLSPLVKPTKYMETNGIPVSGFGWLTDGNGNDVYVPLLDANGKQRSMVSIQSDGNLRFMDYSNKDGWFFVVGGYSNIKTANSLIITDDLNSGLVLNKTTGLPVAVTFSAEGLSHAAKDIHANYPDKGIIVAGEYGNQSAAKAAQAVNGKAVYPIFATGETSQNAEGLTTFHDLAHKSRLGKDAVARQIKPLLKQVATQARGFMPSKQKEIKRVRSIGDNNGLESHIKERAVILAKGRGR